MRLKTIRNAILVAVIVASPAYGQDLGAQVTEQLHRQGYSDVSISRTLLGRLRVTAQSSRYRREIVLDPRNGEILRDLRRPLDGSGIVVRIGDDDAASHPVDSGHGSGSGTGSSGDDGEKEEGDDGDGEGGDADEG